MASTQTNSIDPEFNEEQLQRIESIYNAVESALNQMAANEVTRLVVYEAADILAEFLHRRCSDRVAFPTRTESLDGTVTISDYMYEDVQSHG